MLSLPQSRTSLTSCNLGFSDVAPAYSSCGVHVWWWDSKKDKSKQDRLKWGLLNLTACGLWVCPWKLQYFQSVVVWVGNVPECDVCLRQFRNRKEWNDANSLSWAFLHLAVCLQITYAVQLLIFLILIIHCRKKWACFIFIQFHTCFTHKQSPVANRKLKLKGMQLCLIPMWHFYLAHMRSSTTSTSFPSVLSQGVWGSICPSVSRAGSAQETKGVER